MCDVRMSALSWARLGVRRFEDGRVRKEGGPYRAPEWVPCSVEVRGTWRSQVTRFRVTSVVVKWVRRGVVACWHVGVKHVRLNSVNAGKSWVCEWEAL